MTQLMRDSLKNSLKELSCEQAKKSNSQEKNYHAGLLMQRGLSKWEKDEKQCKQNLIQKLAELNPPEIYQSAFKRWVGITQSNPQFAAHIGQIEGRLYIGLNSAGALETGLSTHHSYGMPMLPGSSVKGAVRHYAESVGLDADICQVLFGSDAENGEVSGALVWHDAWWIPADNDPFVGEIITTHHQDYYNRKKDQADGMESPIPNQQIATRGGFYFCVQAAEGGEAWAQFAVNLLGQMLEQQGMGAKTASGYGYFCELNNIRIIQYMNSLTEPFRQQREQEERKKQKEAEAALPEHERLLKKLEEIKGQLSPSLRANSDNGLYGEMRQALQDAAACDQLSAEQKQQIQNDFRANQLARNYPHWITAKRQRELRDIVGKFSDSN